MDPVQQVKSLQGEIAKRAQQVEKQTALKDAALEALADAQLACRVAQQAYAAQQQKHRAEIAQAQQAVNEARKAEADAIRELKEAKRVKRKPIPGPKSAAGHESTATDAKPEKAGASSS